MKILAELSFVGSAYHGWQVQNNAPSVQKTVQDAMETLLRSPCAVTGCSRTDAGVHARQYFCTFESAALDSFPTDRLPEALNRLLPDDVAIRGAVPVDAGFHPRYDALAKEYEYLIYLGALRDAFLSRRAYMPSDLRLDVNKMRSEASGLVGRHDFSSFCASGGKIGDKTRTVFFCTLTRTGDLLSLKVCADGFLYNMVRIIAGTLIECGCGQKSGVSEILARKDRSLAGRTAPAHGLYLNRVFYDRSELERAIEEQSK